MVYDEVAINRYALQAETMLADVKHSEGGVSIDAVGESLGLSPEQSREIACYLRDLEWAKVSFAGSPRLVLTPLGYREIAKQKRPAWQKWIDAHPKIVATIIFFAGVGASLIAEFLKRLIWE